MSVGTGGAPGASSTGASSVAPPAGAPTTITAHSSANPGTGATPPISSSTADWTSGLSDDMRGYVQNKGFKDASMALDSYRHLETLLGAPKERLLKLPEKADDPAWKEVYSRLGAPPTAKDYGIQVPDGGSKEFAEWAGNTFHELGVTKGQAEKLLGKWNDFQKSELDKISFAKDQNVKEQEASLKKEWGAAIDTNIAIARRAAQEFGLDGKTIDALESSMGYDGVMKLLHKFGSRIGEDSFVSGRSVNGPLTPEAARQRISELKMDPEFGKKYVAGDVSARNEMTRLHQWASPESS